MKSNDIKIHGHRGAAGLELENTIPSFAAAKDLGVDAIELDVQITLDQQFVVCHDDNLQRVSDSYQFISKLSFTELQQIKLHNQQTVPLLRDVLTLIDNIPVVIDIKTNRNLPQLFAIIDDFPDIHCTIVGWPNNIIKACKQLRPDIPALVAKHYTPFNMLRTVKNHHADGLNLNYIWLNPLTYKLAQKRGYQIQAYTVNNVFVARLIKRLYPGVCICTNHPDKFIAELRSNPTNSHQSAQPAKSIK